MASTLFTGASRYSSDFSAVIERQVGIQSLKLTQMQQQRTKSDDAITALRVVDAKITALQSTLQAVEDAVGKSSWQAASSDSTVISASAAEGAAPATYTMKLVSMGAYATSVSSKTVSDPAAGDFVGSGSTSVTLSITNLDTGTPQADKSITISGTTLQDVVDGINAATGLNVRAAVVNLGGSTPKYALSLQSTKYGKFSLQLKDQGGTSLMTIPGNGDPALGSLVEYKVNGTTVTSDSRSVILAPNVTADILKFDNTKDITVTVGQSTSGFETAISAFANAYNAVLDQMDKYTGKDGALVGNSLVSSLKRQMSFAVTSVTGSGALNSLAEIGLEFTRTGRLSFKSDLFSTAAKDRFSDLQALIGSAKTSGFVKVATDALKSIDDAKGNGILETTITALAASLRAEDARIEAEQKRVEQFTKDLQERLAKADAAIAALEQQANYFNNMFEAMRVNQKSMS